MQALGPGPGSILPTLGGCNARRATSHSEGMTHPSPAGPAPSSAAPSCGSSPGAVPTHTALFLTVPAWKGPMLLTLLVGPPTVVSTGTSRSPCLVGAFCPGVLAGKGPQEAEHHAGPRALLALPQGRHGAWQAPAPSVLALRQTPPLAGVPSTTPSQSRCHNRSQAPSHQWPPNPDIGHLQSPPPVPCTTLDDKGRTACVLVVTLHSATIFRKLSPR